MATACPDCGADVELADRLVHLKAGTCAGCGHRLTVVSEEVGPGAPQEEGPAASLESPATGGGAEVEEVVVETGPPCPSCGGVLELSAGEDRRLTAVCSDCDSEFTYVLQTEKDERPPRRESRERDGGDFRQEGPAARPCRKCGEPLRFSTNPDGTVTGICDSCGNRFTLPPRRTDRRDDRRGGGYRSGGDRGGPRAGGWRRGGRSDSGYPSRGRGPPSRGRPQRRRRDRDDDSD